ncbi:hypothetical protein [Amycolatopsis panacis]|uniref:Uncharacterized protein n=1 Tax=Amycolatopsis panacis TaxID=2340917 RepID=A0A419I9T5_9PSEU|nr:hypothetical protein [Amycolatopsis panacis]RJQ89637.1 hypothetical protein D5S19_04085 [Amycolatopsis panacis]
MPADVRPRFRVLGEMLSRWAAERGHDPALVFGDRTWTWAAAATAEPHPGVSEVDEDDGRADHVRERHHRFPKGAVLTHRGVLMHRTVFPFSQSGRDAVRRSARRA